MSRFAKKTNACIEEVVNIINSIQKVKDYYIVDRKLVILFQEEIMLYSVEMINYHLGWFTICHDIIDPEVILNCFPYNKQFKNYPVRVCTSLQQLTKPTEDKLIFLNLKNNEATIGRKFRKFWLGKKLVNKLGWFKPFFLKNFKNNQNHE